MKIKHTTWLGFIVVTVVSLVVWCRFTLPQFSTLNLSVNKAAALTIAKEYLIKEKGVDTSRYTTAIMFLADTESDRYLQKTLQFKGEQEFIRRHDMDMFFWLIRFFRENQKEEFRVAINSATGKVISSRHAIEDTAARPATDEAQAQARAIAFLKDNFNFDPADYTLNSHLTKNYDNRTDYTFSWNKNNVYVTWQNEGSKPCGAKLLTGITVSGDEIMSFYRAKLEIPEEFSRFIEKQKSTGYNLSLLFKAAYIVLLTSATYIVVMRRNHLVMHTAQRFCFILTAVLFVLNIAASLNIFEMVLMNFPTTSSFTDYLARYAMELLIGTFLLTVSILMPSLSGESLHYEVLKERKEGSILYYLTSTFLSRHVCAMVILGYFVSAIMLGIQSVAFEIGYRYLGVWTEQTWMTDLSSTYIPFLTAFIIGFQASFVEEITFRMFAISWIKKLLKSTVVACFFASLIWGFGHSNYLVFPMWFRGIEVTCLGLFLSWMYLRFGIIPVLIGHYVFDVFWSSASYLLGTSHPYYFYSSLGVLLLPLGLGITAFLVNKPQVQEHLRWRLNKHQQFNLEVLSNYVEHQRRVNSKTKEELHTEFLAHGWDVAVVETAFTEEGPAANNKI